MKKKWWHFSSSRALKSFNIFQSAWHTHFNMSWGYFLISQVLQETKLIFWLAFSFKKQQLFLTIAITLSNISIATAVLFHQFQDRYYASFLLFTVLHIFGDLSKPTGGRNMDTLFIKHSIKPFDLIWYYLTKMKLVCIYFSFDVCF